MSARSCSSAVMVVSSGRCEQALGNLDETYSYFEKALALARQLDTSRIGSILHDLLRLDVKAHNLRSAEKRAQEYEKLAELTNDPLLKGESLIMWADLLQETSHPEAAKRYLLGAENGSSLHHPAAGGTEQEGVRR